MALAEAPARLPHAPGARLDPRRLAPTAVAAVLAAVYVIVSPPSLDLAAHLLRAKLFSTEGFGIWNNWWYAGHNVPGYSVLFPPVAAAISPQLAAALAAVATAVTFEALVHRHFGPDAWLGALWFGAATATDLYTGRLTFAFGLLPAVATALALQRGRPLTAAGLALLTALASPVAALFAAVVGGAYAIARRSPAGVAVAAAALVPVLVLLAAFPEGGSEPFAFSAFWPVVLISVAALFAVPREERALRAGIVLYLLGCIASYAVSSPAGSNVARLAPLLAGPVAALLWWPRRRWLLLAVALPLLYIQWQAPIRDVRTAAGDPSTDAAYYRPLLAFLERQPGPPFRVEVPFTRFHGEAYYIAPRFPLARGWERQLDIKYNHLFYGGPLNAGTYEAWLRTLAVRFVAVADVGLDYSARAEKALIDRGLAYLEPVGRSGHWRIYAVRDPASIVQGPATLTAVGPNSVSLEVQRPGRVLVRVRYSPYWALSGAAGCVSPAGQFTSLTVRRAGALELVIRFSLGRIGARSARCT